MKTSRQKILDYLRLHRSCSANELSQAMKMTPANARHHLQILVDQGAVIQVGERLLPHQRGRPERIFRLADQDRENNLDLLAGLLLKHLQQTDSREEIEINLSHLASGLAGAQAEGSNIRSLGARLALAVQQLIQLHYQARWEARPGAPEIYLGNCPYRKIIAGHPELCRMDELLLQQLIGRPVELQVILADDHSGGSFCRFTLRN